MAGLQLQLLQLLFQKFAPRIQHGREFTGPRPVGRQLQRDAFPGQGNDVVFETLTLTTQCRQRGDVTFQSRLMLAAQGFLLGFESGKPMPLRANLRRLPATGKERQVGRDLQGHHVAKGVAAVLPGQLHAPVGTPCRLGLPQLGSPTAHREAETAKAHRG